MSKGTAAKGPNLPWVEKYRPAKLDDLISHEDIIKTIIGVTVNQCQAKTLAWIQDEMRVAKIKILMAYFLLQTGVRGERELLHTTLDLNKFIKEDQLPHLLFYGPPGTGKTSTILSCAKQLYSPNQINSMVLELNASDDRGIGIVRGQILSFASTRTIFNTGFKLIILDEADAMTNDAQNALRRIIEKFTENVRFCIICNYLSKIIPALQSRCTRFRFAPLAPEQILPRLEYVIEQENINVTADGKKALLTLSQGDMRKTLNILQSTSMAYKEVTEDNVYTCVGHPLKSDISNIVKWLLNEDFSSAYKKIQDLKTAKGLALQDILTEVHLYIHRIELPSAALVGLIIKMADIENYLASGANENIQLSALLSAFIFARDMVPADTES